MAHRVVLTAASVISSLGSEPEEILRRFQEDAPVFVRSDLDPEIVVSPAASLDMKSVTGPFKDSRYLNRGAQMAVTAAMKTLAGANLSPKDRAQAGLFVGIGPNLDLGGECPVIEDGRMNADLLQSLWILRFLPNTAASIISKLGGLHGENGTLSTACSSSLQAVGEGYRRIRDGYLDLALAGGGDSRLNAGGLLAYKRASALFAGEGDPGAASRPFDEGRRGFVPGEGGAFFLLEERERALQRGAAILGEIAGYGCSLDGVSMTAPEESGTWAQRAVEQALAEAGIGPEAVEVISAHGTSTPLNDVFEARILARLFGAAVPVLAFKSWVGHNASACGAVELALGLICFDAGRLPPVRNLSAPCHAGVNFVRQGRSASPRTAVFQNFGFGGQNAALVLKREA